MRMPRSYSFDRISPGSLAMSVAKRRASSWINAPHAPVCNASHSEAPPISYGSVTNRRGRHEEIAAVLALVFAVVAGTATVLTVVTPQSAIADACTSGNC